MAETGRESETGGAAIFNNQTRASGDETEITEGKKSTWKPYD